MRKQETPRALHPREIGRRGEPLSLTNSRSGGTQAASFSVVAISVFSVLRLRLLMPMSLVLQPERAVELGAVMHLDQHVHAPIDGRPSSSARLVVGRTPP